MDKKEVKNNSKTNNNFVPRSGKLPGWAIFLIVFFSFIIMAFYILLFAIFIYAIVDEASQESNTIKDEDTYTENITKNFTIDPNIKGYYDSKNKEYVLEGVVTNNSNKSFDDVEIEYYLYDENGVILSVARAYIEDINPNEKWQFKAVSDDNIEKVASYKLVKITEDSSNSTPDINVDDESTSSVSDEDLFD